MEKSFSIIIPHYNSLETLTRLLEGIVGYNDTEVIIIDDNSTEHLDKLSEMKKILEPGGIKFYRNESGKNSAGICRNIGIENAVGKWLLFADADDYFMENWHDIVHGFYDRDSDIVYFMPSEVVWLE